jgi:hypothetical protein
MKSLKKKTVSKTKKAAPKSKAKDKQGQTVKSGRLGDLKIVINQDRGSTASAEYYAIRAQLPDGKETALLFTAKEIEKAAQRAAKNPEDVPSVPFLFDFFD